MESSKYNALSHYQRQCYYIFMAKVETRGDVRTDMSPCWTHSMSKSSSGYGQIMFSGIAYGSHVFSYLIHNGFPEIPKGYDVSHNCDNKNCVNPDHLSLETHKQNTIDAVERIRIAKPIKISTVNLEPCYNCIKAHRACEGGGAECLRCMEEKLECVYKEYKVTPGAFKLGECSGENNKNAKLNWVKVREIRAKISAGIPYGGLKKLALEYNVSYILMQKIKSNVNWKIEDDPGI